MFKFIKKLIQINKNDPVKKCNLYKDIKCSHIDGFLCDFPQCTMEYQYNKQILEKLSGYTKTFIDENNT